ncbi:hypothetical protein B484DRAFT_458591 [Ochromonadaceae sp. CCMP2298]|nr:hypothetical protein B484DRAFT_458591 [Ochromonadaceae sp. CCMP2298]
MSVLARLLLLLATFALSRASPVTMRTPTLVPPMVTFEQLRVTDLKGKTKTIASLVKGKRGPSLVLFFTHTGDLTSFELAQQLTHYLPQLQKSMNVVCVTPGATPQSAQMFCDMTQFPPDLLHIDATAAAYESLQLSKGFLPGAPVSPYLKLLPMLAGIGSPGTIQEVLRGYFGDKSVDPAWIRSCLRLVEQEKFDVLGSGYQRPFELATVRLQNMMDVLGSWEQLVPATTVSHPDTLISYINTFFTALPPVMHCLLPCWACTYSPPLTPDP